MPRRRKSAIRAWLFRQNPHCHYCGVLTVLHPPNPKNKYLPDNLATIEHLVTRFDPHRQQHQAGERRLVNACRKCNAEQGAKRQREVPLEELHRRSGRSPSNRGAA